MNKQINMRKDTHSGPNFICRQEQLSRQSEFEGDSSLKKEKFFFAIYQIQFFLFYKFNIFMQKTFSQITELCVWEEDTVMDKGKWQDCIELMQHCCDLRSDQNSKTERTSKVTSKHLSFKPGIMSGVIWQVLKG